MIFFSTKYIFVMVTMLSPNVVRVKKPQVLEFRLEIWLSVDHLVIGLDTFVEEPEFDEIK